MNQDLLDDLAAFDRGALTRSDVVARHGVEALPALAAHDRLREAVATVPAFDVEAGWARVIDEIAEPAPVVRLPQKPRRPRSVVLAAAAALMLAGSAFAALGPRLLGEDRPMVPAVSEGTDLDGEPRGAGALGEDLAGGRDGSETPADANDRHDDARDPQGTPGADSGDGDGDGTGGGDGGGGGGGGEDGPEDPNDRDQGRGNDGEHDDRGGGNDGREGQDRTDTKTGKPDEGSKDRSTGKAKAR